MIWGYHYFWKHPYQRLPEFHVQDADPLQKRIHPSCPLPNKSHKRTMIQWTWNRFSIFSWYWGPQTMIHGSSWRLWWITCIVFFRMNDQSHTTSWLSWTFKTSAECSKNFWDLNCSVISLHRRLMFEAGQTSEGKLANIYMLTCAAPVWKIIDRPIPLILFLGCRFKRHVSRFLVLALLLDLRIHV